MTKTVYNKQNQASWFVLWCTTRRKKWERKSRNEVSRFGLWLGPAHQTQPLCGPTNWLSEECQAPPGGSLFAHAHAHIYYIHRLLKFDYKMIKGKLYFCWSFLFMEVIKLVISCIRYCATSCYQILSTLINLHFQSIWCLLAGKLFLVHVSQIPYANHVFLTTCKDLDFAH